MSARVRQPTVMQVARGLVMSLIEWEINAADGESMTTACARFGYGAVVGALEAIEVQLQKAGVRYLAEDGQVQPNG